MSAAAVKQALARAERHEREADEARQEAIRIALADADGNIAVAADALGVSYVTAHRWIDKYGLRKTLPTAEARISAAQTKRWAKRRRRGRGSTPTR
jgi:DNA-binding NtrC family response regulator